MSEVEWRPIPGWEGYYEVSNQGQARSLPRVDSRGAHYKGTILRPTEWGAGYLHIGLSRNRGEVRALMTVHKAVMLAFVGDRPEAHDIRHLDGNRANNNLANLAYGTRRENNLDAVRHGTNHNSAKTHCKRGHELAGENLRQRGRSRVCLACKKLSAHQAFLRRRAS